MYIDNLYENKIYILLFWLMCGGLNKLYDQLDNYLLKNLPEYNEISPSHKKQYVLSNIIKSGILVIFSMFSILLLYK